MTRSDEDIARIRRKTSKTQYVVTLGLLLVMWVGVFYFMAKELLP